MQLAFAETPLTGVTLPSQAPSPGACVDTGWRALPEPPSLVTMPCGSELELESSFTLSAKVRPTAYAPRISSSASSVRSSGTNHGESVTFSITVGSSSYCSVRWVPTTRRPRRTGSSSVSSLSRSRSFFGACFEVCFGSCSGGSGSARCCEPSLCASSARSYAAR